MTHFSKLIPVILLAVLLTGCLKQELQSGLNEQEAQEIIVLLKQHGLDADHQLVAKGKEQATWTVAVRGGNQNLVAAWRVLQENGLPRQRVKGLDEVFGTPGLIPTAGEEKAKLLVGLSGELSRTLKTVAGVVDARVHVVLPENSPLLEKSQWSPTTAAVLLRYRGAQPPLKEAEVKALVSKGIEGLTAEQVAVVFLRVAETPEEARGITWYVGNQEITLGAVALLVIAAFLALLQTAQVRRLRKQIAALRESYERRDGTPAVARSGS
jgi:type III secretion protein J